MKACTSLGGRGKTERRGRGHQMYLKEELGRKQRRDGWGRAEACGQGFA